MFFHKSTQTCEDLAIQNICPICGYTGEMNSHINDCVRIKRKKEIICPICLNAVDRSIDLVVLSCGHLMCKECYFKYLQEYLGSKYNQSKIEESTCNMPLFEYKFKCPVCRGECLTSKTMKVYKG